MEKQLIIIGTSHISQDSVDSVRRSIETDKPDIVALELDQQRAHALLHNHKTKISPKLIKKIGVKGFLFLALASFLQKKLGKLVGVEPGSEMKEALRTALKEKKQVMLIDRNIEVTLRRLSKTLGWKERLRLFGDIVQGPFNKELKEIGHLDLRRVPEKKLIAQILGKFKERYPALYNVLVEERNQHMATCLAHIMQTNPERRVLAVVGAGHEEELAKLVAEKSASSARAQAAS